MDASYRHPKHDSIVRLVEYGKTDSAIADELKVDRRAAARVRRLLGMPPMTNATTLGDKLDRFSTEPDANGHVTWTGRTSRAGAPLIRHLGAEIPAARAAFERRTGRAPVGTCRAECDDVSYCIAPSHVMDDIERRNLRGQMRALHGLDPQPWDECRDGGHGWTEHGRFEPDLTPYCKACGTDRMRRVREARDETRNEA